MAARIMTVLVVALAVVLTTPAATSDVEIETSPSTMTSREAEPCDWWDEYRAALNVLGEDWRDWYVESGYRIGDNYGIVHVDTGIAAVNPATPCHMVRDVVVHEWIHLRQLDHYGAWPAVVAAAGSELDAELVADCGMLFLVHTDHHPYIMQSMITRGYGCTLGHMGEAARLIEQSGV